MGSDAETLADVTGTLDIMQIRVEEGAPAAGRTPAPRDPGGWTDERRLGRGCNAARTRTWTSPTIVNGRVR